MRLNGNLVLNANGLSEIQNAVVERVAANPTFNVAEKGRFIFNTTENKVYFNDGVQWAAMATGGNAAALQTEVDALEASLGALINATGGFEAEGIVLSNVTGATSISDIIDQLDAALTAEIAARTSADSAEATARANADTTLQSNIDAEATARASADTTLQGNIDAEVTRATGAEAALQAEIDAEEIARANADSTLTTNLANEVTNRTNADTTLQNAIDSEAATRLAADNQLASDLVAETSAREAADLVHTNDIAARVKLAGDTMSGDLDFNSLYTVKGLRAPTLPGDGATKAYVDATAAGLAWKEPVDSVGAALPGTAAEGDRFLNTTDFKIYTATAIDTWDAGVAPTDGWALFDRATETGYVYSGTAWVQFTGTGQVTAGVGLAKTGNVIDINLGAGIAELPSDEVGIDLFTGGGLFLTVDGTNPDTTTAAQVSIRLDGDTITRTASGIKVADATILRITNAENAITTEVSDRTAADATLQSNIDNEVTARTNADTALQGSIDAEVTRATAAEGTLTSNLAAETSAREAADTTLQGNIDAEATARAAADTAIDAKLAKIYFLYDGASATSHSVAHNLNQKYASVTVIDTATDEVIIPQSIVFVDANNLTVTLNAALAIKVVVVAVGF